MYSVRLPTEFFNLLQEGICGPKLKRIGQQISVSIERAGTLLYMKFKICKVLSHSKLVLGSKICDHFMVLGLDIAMFIIRRPQFIFL